MVINGVVGQEANLVLTRNELEILNNSINEAMGALDDWEFSTRMGYERSEVQDLFSQIHDLILNMRAV